VILPDPADADLPWQQGETWLFDPTQGRWWVGVGVLFVHPPRGQWREVRPAAVPERILALQARPCPT
jgi:hypothetical protein